MIPEIIQVFIELRDEVPPSGEVCSEGNLDLFIIIIFIVTPNDDVVLNSNLILGSRDGAVVRALASHQCGSGSILELDAICGLSLLLVLFSAPRGFSPGTPVFPSPQKPTFPNSNSIQISMDE